MRRFLVRSGGIRPPWLLTALSDIVPLIPGTSSLDHLQQNRAVADIALTGSDLALLKRSA